LLEGDLPNFDREAADEGRIRFVPVGEGPVLTVSSRVEKRFLGRTEIAVFEADLGVPMPEPSRVELRHTGGLRRTGVTAVVVEGAEYTREVADRLSADRDLIETLLPLDFTRFEIRGDRSATMAQVELMGASLVAIALPPIRSYVHLHTDQREAMIKTLDVLCTLVGSV
jgi:hypothetical protein